LIGEVINNRYEIKEQLGKGGMGVVYRGVNSETERDVAVKVIGIELTSEPDMLERFKREGEALRKLKHPNIVGFVEAFLHEDNYVIVMEYVPGGNLLELIKGGSLSTEQITQITLDLCDALIRAHRLNIIHRDLKPENVMISKDGTPKLADFGVARLNEGTRMTRSGTQVGTPFYMSPEAWQGKPLDEQADIWSLGVILFEMLSGKVPFEGITAASVMNKVLTEPPPDIRRLQSDTPRKLSAVVTKMLTRDKRRRYKTMRQVAVELENVHVGGEHVPMNLSGMFLLFATVIVIGLIAFFAFRMGAINNSLQSAPTDEPTVEPALTQEPEFTKTPTQSPVPEKLTNCVQLLSPIDESEVPAVGQTAFSWTPLDDAVYYRLTITIPTGETVDFDSEATVYDRYMETFSQGGTFQWVVSPLDAGGNAICVSNPYVFNKSAYQQPKTIKKTNGDGGGSGEDNSSTAPISEPTCQPGPVC